MTPTHAHNDTHKYTQTYKHTETRMHAETHTHTHTQFSGTILSACFISDFLVIKVHHGIQTVIYD